MWNLSYANKKCNEFERMREHRTHLERIVTSKHNINTTEPKRPQFLTTRLKKEAIEQGICIII